MGSSMHTAQTEDCLPSGNVALCEPDPETSFKSTGTFENSKSLRWDHSDRSSLSGQLVPV